MNGKECIAMILAGGRGERLGTLTNYTAKPMVTFGGSHKIIDFSLSNCKHSGIGTVGVLTQYFSGDLHNYIDYGQVWNSDRNGFNVIMRPSEQTKNPYVGTADAVYKNIDFIEQFSPEHVLILAGDHVYKMDYHKMLKAHEKAGVEVTIASNRVPMAQASEYGILQTDRDNAIVGFEEKPRRPKSNLASMGVYIFKWSALKKYLIQDNCNSTSENDFGKNIIPAMLYSGEKMCSYLFNGYWRDVGTLDSLWEANMDLLNDSSLKLQDKSWEIFTSEKIDILDYQASKTAVTNSIITGNCTIFGSVVNSVLSDSVIVREGAQITDSIIMPGVYIGENAIINKAIIGPNAKILDNVKIGTFDEYPLFINPEIGSRGISLIAPWMLIDEHFISQMNSHIERAANHMLQNIKPCRQIYQKYIQN